MQADRTLASFFDDVVVAGNPLVSRLSLATNLILPMHHFNFLNLLFPFICLIMLVVAATACWKSNNEYKARWLAVIILLPFFGPLLYFQFARGHYVSDL